MHPAYFPPGTGPSIFRTFPAFSLLLIATFTCLFGFLPSMPAAVSHLSSDQPAVPLLFAPAFDRADGVQLQAVANGATWGFASHGVELSTPGGQALAIEFPGANPAALLRGADAQPASINTYRGAEPAAWHPNTRLYGAVVYDALFRGVALHYNGDTRRLKGTYTVAPGTDPAVIRWRYAGADGMRVDVAGDLQVALRGRTLVERAPIAWQDTPSGRRMVPVRFALAGDSAGFALGSYDRALPLVIDPEIVYSSYLGGNSDEESRGIVRDSAGNLYLFGKTYSTDFGGSPNTIAGSDDLFVAKFDPTGKRLLYRTVLGGKSGENAIAIAVNAAGEVALTAYSGSLDFPLLNPLLNTRPDTGGVVAKLDAAGKLAFSTYLNIGFRAGRNIDFAPDGSIVFTGQDWAGATAGREQAGIYILAGDGSNAVQLGSFGGDWIEWGSALAVGPDGRIYIGGTTEFRDGGFPLSDTAFQKVCGAKSYGAGEPYCDEDGFVAVLNAQGTEILHATYLGGDGSDTVSGIDVDNAGNVYVAGYTSSQNFPTKNAFQGGWLGADNFANGFVTKLAPDLSAQVYSTFLAAQDQNSSEYVYDLWVDGSGNLAVTGLTNGQYFPVKGAVQAQLDGTVCLGSNERYCYDAFVSSFDPNGALVFSTYLGGGDDDIGYALVGDGTGGYWVTGRTEANDWVTTADAAQPRAMMQSDSFITHLGTPDGGAAPAPQPDQPGRSFRAYVPLTVR